MENQEKGFQEEYKKLENFIEVRSKNNWCYARHLTTNEFAEWVKPKLESEGFKVEYLTCSLYGHIIINVDWHYQYCPCHDKAVTWVNNPFNDLY